MGFILIYDVTDEKRYNFLEKAPIFVIQFWKDPAVIVF